MFIPAIIPLLGKFLFVNPAVCVLHSRLKTRDFLPFRFWQSLALAIEPQEIKIGNG